MKISSIKSAEHYAWGDQCDGWHLLKSEKLSIIQERVPGGASERRHFHSRSEQFFYILSGIATMELTGETLQLKAHQGIHVPPGTIHQLSNQHENDLIFIVTSTPPAQDNRVEA